MFKKLLSNLPFNPSLINQVSFYAKRVHNESTVRKTGLIMLVLAMFVQLFAVISPPQSSVSASPDNDLINGGFANRDQAVLHCLNNNEDYNKILAHYNITCTDVANAATVTLHSTDYNRNLYSMGRKPYGLAGEQPVNIEGANGGRTWLRYLWSWDKNGVSTYQALSGTNKDGLRFFILYNCGNLVFIGIPPNNPPPPPPPPTELSCTNLGMSVADGARVRLGSKVSLRGQASGKNIRFGQTVTMSYEYVNAANGKVIGKASTGNIGFVNGVANDPGSHVFTANTAGQYVFKLTVYDGSKAVKGSATGDCVKRITVQKACDESSNIKNIDECIDIHKKARNITQNIADANGTTAKPGDVIEYSLIAENTANIEIPKFVVQENVSDILDYADITDFGGGKLTKGNLLTWPATSIKAKSKLTKVFKVKVKNPLPSTPRSTSDPGHFDMTMTNVYGDTVTIKLPPPITKQTEIVTQSLPNTGPGETLAVGFGITAIVGYFFARSRLMAKELDVVRKEYTTSGGY